MFSTHRLLTVCLATSTAIAGTSLPAPSARAGTVRSDLPTSGLEAVYQEGLRPELRSVVKLNSIRGDGNYGTVGSAVLINDFTLLTASHILSSAMFEGSTYNMVEDYFTGVAHDETRSRFNAYVPDSHGPVGAQGNQPDTYANHTVVETVRVRGLTPQFGFAAVPGGGVDLALMRLTGNSTLHEYVDPATLLTTDQGVGEEATIVGFGNYGTGTNGQDINSRLWARRAVTNTIDGNAAMLGAVVDPSQLPPFLDPAQQTATHPGYWEFNEGRGLWENSFMIPAVFPDQHEYQMAGGSANEIVFDFDHHATADFNHTGSATLTRLEGVNAGGDSGGGVFVERDGQMYLAGINSWRTTPLHNAYAPAANVSSGYGTIGHATSVYTYAEWIEDQSVTAAFQSSAATGEFIAGPWHYSDGATSLGSQHTIVINAPGLFDPGEDGTTIEEGFRDTQAVTLSEDLVANRMRVRRGSNLVVDLQQNTLTFASTSASTAALVVGRDFGDRARLQISNGTINVHDVELAGVVGSGYAASTTSHMKSIGAHSTTGDLYLHDGAELNVADTIYIGTLKPTAFRADIPDSMREANGRGVVRVNAGATLNAGRIVIGEMSKVEYTPSSFLNQSGSRYLSGGQLEIVGGSVTAGQIIVNRSVLTIADGSTLSFGSLVLDDTTAFVTLAPDDIYIGFQTVRSAHLPGNTPEDYYFGHTPTITTTTLTVPTPSSLSGAGLIEGSVEFHGLLAPGGIGGVIEVTGDASLAGIMSVTLDEIYEPSSARLVVGGEAALGGDLFLLLGADTPAFAVDDEIQLIDAGSISGEFAGTTELYSGGMFRYLFDLVATDMLVSLRVTDVGLLGDYDADGFVGVEDLDILLANWGDTVAVGEQSLGDGSGDGLIGQADLQIVLDNWGAGLPPGGNVPEPGTLAGLAVLLLCTSRRRRR